MDASTEVSDDHKKVTDEWINKVLPVNDANFLALSARLLRKLEDPKTKSATRGEFRRVCASVGMELKAE